MCPALTPPTNGVIVYASDTSADFDFETTATFSCNPGFGMVGGDEVRTCGGNGSSATGVWTGNQTVCECTFFFSYFKSYIQNCNSCY